MQPSPCWPLVLERFLRTAGSHDNPILVDVECPVTVKMPEDHGPKLYDSSAIAGPAPPSTGHGDRHLLARYSRACDRDRSCWVAEISRKSLDMDHSYGINTRNISAPIYCNTISATAFRRAISPLRSCTAGFPSGRYHSSGSRVRPAGGCWLQPRLAPRSTRLNLSSNQGPRVQRLLLQAHIERRGDGDVGHALLVHNRPVGVIHPPSSPHPLLKTTFGPVEISRMGDSRNGPLAMGHPLRVFVITHTSAIAV